MAVNYKNWVPKGMVCGFFSCFVVFLLLFIIFGCTSVLDAGVLKTVLFWLLLIGTLVFLVASFWLHLGDSSPEVSLKKEWKQYNMR